MNTFLAYLWRLIVILFGFAAATLGAGSIFGSALIFREAQSAIDVTDIFETVFSIAMFGFFIASVGGIIVAIPFVIFAVFAETFGWRGFLLHGVMGGLFGLGSILLAPVSMEAKIVTASIAAGIAGGWLYWLIAGRNAGKLLDRISAERSAS